MAVVENRSYSRNSLSTSDEKLTRASGKRRRNMALEGLRLTACTVLRRFVHYQAVQVYTWNCAQGYLIR